MAATPLLLAALGYVVANTLALLVIVAWLLRHRRAITLLSQSQQVMGVSLGQAHAANALLAQAMALTVTDGK